MSICASIYRTYTSTAYMCYEYMLGSSRLLEILVHSTVFGSAESRQHSRKLAVQKHGRAPLSLSFTGNKHARLSM